MVQTAHVVIQTTNDALLTTKALFQTTNVVERDEHVAVQEKQALALVNHDVSLASSVEFQTNHVVE